ncbi:hypothetical protein IV102_00055 [bacterium]|nr:hypothetical protein [bacterium]
MRQRAFIQVDGSPGAGKTTFIERLLELGWISTCIRTHESNQSARPDEAGAETSATFRVRARDFFEIDALQDKGQAMLVQPILLVLVSAVALILSAIPGRVLSERVPQEI